MLPILEFVFESYAHFWGTWLLIVTTLGGLSFFHPVVLASQTTTVNKTKKEADG